MRKPVGDLRSSPEHLALYFAHLREREDIVPYFYCDSEHLVTIGIGHLVDQRGGADVVGQGLARDLFNRGDVTFSTTAGVRVVAATDVESDWQRVKDRGRTHPADGANAYRDVARLRIDEGSIRALVQTKVFRLCADLYKKRSFMLSYEPRASMAFVDVLYNPAGVVLYGGSSDVTAMWAALDPTSRKFDTAQALRLFESIWAHRATVRYGMRHFARVQWLRAALETGFQSA